MDDRYRFRNVHWTLTLHVGGRYMLSLKRLTRWLQRGTRYLLPMADTLLAAASLDPELLPGSLSTQSDSSMLSCTPFQSWGIPIVLHPTAPFPQNFIETGKVQGAGRVEGGLHIGSRWVSTSSSMAFKVHTNPKLETLWALWDGLRHKAWVCGTIWALTFNEGLVRMEHCSKHFTGILSL